MYAIGRSTVVAIVHEGIAILQKKLVPEAILFPTGRELDQVLMDFAALCGLPCCGGALDGTFIPIKKPADFEDTYFYYKKFTATIVLACLDARGIFTYANAGRPGSVGDLYTYRQGSSGEWLAHSPRTTEGTVYRHQDGDAEATRSLEKTAISGGFTRKLRIFCRWKELYAYEAHTEPAIQLPICPTPSWARWLEEEEEERHRRKVARERKKVY